MLSVYLLRMEKEWICWLMSFVCCSFVKPSRSSSVSVLFVLIASLSDVAPLSSMMLPVYLMRIEKRGLLMNVICVLVFFVFTIQIKCCKCCVWFQCFTYWCCPCVSNAVDCWFGENGKEWIVDGCHVGIVCLHLHLKSSSASVVFDFNASLNDVAPVSPMLLTVDLIRMKEWLISEFSLCMLIPFEFTL